jgi:energy-coupling factor transporter ATP-binding protein EcfA2
MDVNNKKKKPIFLIINGPKGCGKSSIINKLQNYLNINMDYSEKIIIDDLVENNPYYKKKINSILMKFCNVDNIEKCDVKKCKKILFSPTKEIINDFYKAYSIALKKINCNKENKNYGIKQIKKENKKDCDSINDKKFITALHERKNIIYERRGLTYENWFFKDPILNKMIQEYHIILLWPIVDICKLLERNKKRAFESLKSYLQDQKNSAPRLPDIDFIKYKKELIQIQKTFENIVQKCSNPKKINSAFCKHKSIQIILFDNNKKTNPNPILYDSFIHNEKKSNSIEKYNTHKTDCK